MKKEYVTWSVLVNVIPFFNFPIYDDNNLNKTGGKNE